jgi:hypothetical protein
MINVVICGGYSPQARILRAAVRNVAQCGDVRVITVCPALAGFEKSIEEISSLDPANTVVVDACDGGCGNQGLAKFGVKPKAVAIMDKYPVMTERTVKLAEEKVRSFLKEVQG